MDSDHVVAKYLPGSVEAMAAAIKDITSQLDDGALIAIAVNRDFGEDERYVVKDQLDQSLITSPYVSLERRRIENIFRTGDVTKSVNQYLDTYQNHMAEIHRLLTLGVATAREGSDSQLFEFWRYMIGPMDRDNAHAMYLSSDNWEFSVFQALIVELQRLSSHVPDNQSILLTGGIEDVRTSVFHQFGNTYRGLDRERFVHEIRSRGDWLRPNGIMPLFAFKAATALAPQRSKSTVHEKFDQAIRETIPLGGKRAERLRSYSELFRELFAARAAYDIYEYFGYYALARNYIILQTRDRLVQRSPEQARAFWYAATTYQYTKIAELLPGHSPPRNDTERVHAV